MMEVIQPLVPNSVVACGIIPQVSRAAFHDAAVPPYCRQRVQVPPVAVDRIAGVCHSQVVCDP